MERVSLPSELQDLLDKKEKFGGKTKDTAALRKVYTNDVLHLNPLAIKWIKGENALKFIFKSITTYKLFPTSYDVIGNGGYIAGYQTITIRDTTEYISNFHYGIKKDAEGLWRISSEMFTMKGPPQVKAITADKLITELNNAEIKKAAVLSTAFWFGSPTENVVGDEYEQVRAENDWLAAQVAQYPDRLFGFCSLNPLKDYAVEELNRCIEGKKFVGLKLHVGNSRIDVLNAEAMDKLKTIFRIANEKRFPIIIHSYTSIKYGPEQAKAFLEQILPLAPDILVQIAHMGASGPNYHADDAFEVYAMAAANKDPRMKNVYVDVASMVTENTTPEKLQLVAKRLRQFGLKRVLFASDRTPGNSNEPPVQAWQSFKKLPLTADEFKIVAENVAPYFKNDNKIPTVQKVNSKK
jgi:predicted TIM-barrel fold metal-dependent hydrolase